jgi:hypothetical protein
MVFHHEIALEQAMLNEAILQHEDEKETKKEISKNKVAPALKTIPENEPLEKKTSIITGEPDTGNKPKPKPKDKKTGKYSYGDIICFKYCCCKKKTQKFKNYEDHMDTIKERMDIRNMITNSGNVNVLSNVLLEPY